MERVVITGIGLVTPVAIGTEATWEALLLGKSGIGLITLFDTTGFRCKIAGEVKNWEPLQFVPKRKLPELDRFMQFAVGAAHLALKDAELSLSDADKEECGAILGVGIGGLHTLEKTKETLLSRGPSKISPYAIPGIISNLAAGQVSMAFGLKGVNYCTTSACSSGAHAIGAAVDWIRMGRSSVMLAGGAEATITPVGVGAFDAMRALSTHNSEPTAASRPFDIKRDGFVSGEGSAVLVLESLSRARSRGAPIYAEISGYGTTSDAFHLTQPSGEGARRSMQMALKDAKKNPSEVGYINAHGTSTPIGDIEESKAIEEVFGDHALEQKLWVSSTKSMMGHLLGAAGAVETAVCALVVKRGQIPPTINLDNLDPACRLDYVPNHARERHVEHALNNSFGFGGTNCSLMLSKV